MIRPAEYDDRGIFVDRGTLWRPKIGARDGVIEPVPDPWFDRLLLRWLPRLALRRAQARQALRQLEQSLAEQPGTTRLQCWDHEAQRWSLPAWVRASSWAVRRR